MPVKIISAHTAIIPANKYAGLIHHAVLLFKTSDGWIRVHQLQFPQGKPAKLVQEAVTDAEVQAHTIDRTADDPHAVAQRTVRALQEQGENGGAPYCAITNNCEQNVSVLFDGERKSPQLRAWLAVGAIAILVVGGLFFIARASKSKETPPLA